LLASFLLQTFAPIREMMEAVDSQMASLAGVNQMFHSSAFWHALAKMGCCEDDSASREPGWLTISFDASASSSGETMETALTCTFTAVP
jgi:hypothetical protein